ncbi:MAG TPA: glycosyltransferase [Thermoanaerobaculia bacterium]|nr:glycosyltransferase [Thermoanaerobaculia bacterium]
MTTNLQIGLLTTYYGVFLIVTVYALHRLYLVRLRRRHAMPSPQLPQEGALWPSVTVQLPVYNEPNVIERLLDAAGSLEYRGPLEIQLLDDSTDETSCLAAERIAVLRSRGINAVHLRREGRDGFKAGALAYGIQRSSSELFAVFDADFLPSPDFLTRVVPHFANRSVGMVQVRWGHVNREASLLTRVQAIYLDAHFAVESAARYVSGRFFNFNGTAGVWRREAIAEAGGWSAATLTEDLDLSYRAQLAGWKFVFLTDMEVAAELPVTMSAFQSQQHRWAKGSIQTAIRILPALLRAPLSFRVKVEAIFHLTANLAYPMTLLLGLLLMPALAVRYQAGLMWLALLDAAAFIAATAAVLSFYIEGQRRAGRPPLTLSEILNLLPVGIGLSLGNSRAVLEGLIERGGEFVRTPKWGCGQRVVTRGERFGFPAGELALLVFFLGASTLWAGIGRFVPLPFLLIFVAGYGQVVLRRLAERS